MPPEVQSFFDLGKIIPQIRTAETVKMPSTHGQTTDLSWSDSQNLCDGKVPNGRHPDGLRDIVQMPHMLKHGSLTDLDVSLLDSRSCRNMS